MTSERIVIALNIIHAIHIALSAPGTDDIERRSEYSLKYWSSDVKEAIEVFTREYQSQHKLKVIIHSPLQLQKTTLFELGVDDRVFGGLKLHFSLRKDNGQERNSSVYLKVPELRTSDNYVEKLLCYDKEKFMYGTILPLIHGSGASEKFSPNFYGSTKANIMVVENTREAGFHPVDGFLNNVDLVIPVFETMARFHALSIIRVNEQHMKKLDQFNEKRSFLFGFDDNENFTIFKKFVEHIYPGLSSDTANSVSYVLDESGKARDLAYIVDETAFNVIIIGDVTRMSVFFRAYDKEGTQQLKCKFVDFQMSRRGSPVIDLVNYLITSVHVGIVEDHGILLFQSYLKEFEKQLQISGVDDRYKYDVEDLFADLKKYKNYFLYKLIFHLCQIMANYAPSCEPGNMDRDIYDDIFESSDFFMYFLDWMDVISKW